VEFVGERDTRYWKTWYSECSPEEVAYEFLKYRRFGNRLPPELVDYRKCGDPEVYNNGREATKLSVAKVELPETLPRWDGTRLTFDGRICKEFSRRAPRQMEILDAFERPRWIRQVSFKGNHVKQIEYTVNNINHLWKSSLIRFRFKRKSYSGVVIWSPIEPPH
jgi:hypothetical protein